MIYTRAIANECKKMSKSYPVLTIIGPRQSGKTTLVKSIFAKKPYMSLEDTDVREFATSDPRAFLAKYPKGAILDEIQRAPELLSYIQTIVDNKQTAGMFILTGSHQLSLQQAITQSLAGRTAIVTLMPLTIAELQQDLSLDDYIHQGFFPRIHTQKLDPSKAYRNYIQTYIEKDVRQLINLKDLKTFQHFLKLLSGRIGQLVNCSSLANDLGISYHTVNNWLSVLEASFIVFRIQPYYENFGKRIVKAPKVYFTDVGLATYLLDIENTEQLARDPLRGHLVENLILMELVKTRLNQGLDPHLYFYRDQQGNEVDVIYKSGNSLIPIEIKASQTFHSDFLKGLNYFANLVGKRCKKGYLVYNGNIEQKIHNFKILNFKNSHEILL